MTTEETLFCLLRNEICKDALPKNFDIKNEAKALYRLSSSHGISHLLGDVIYRNKLLTDGKTAREFKMQIEMAVLHYEQQNAVLNSVKKLFDEAKIEYIPLKGAIVREYYAEPWMRSSCDVDILIHEEDVSKASEVLIKNGFETKGKKNFHDILFNYGSVLLELHFSIYENDKRMDSILNEVWEYSEKVGEYEYREIPEFYIFHHICHMAYHFLTGGCGIRPVIDLFILRNKGFYSEEKLLPLLEKCNLVKFYRTMTALSVVWLKGEEESDVILRTGRYIIKGGAFGTKDTANAVGVAKNRGKRKYLLKIAFPSYRVMCVNYPVLKKHKALLPFCYVHRAFAKLFGKDKQKVKVKISGAMSQNKNDISEISNLLKDLELR